MAKRVKREPPTPEALLLGRVAKYRKPPTIQALRNRLKKALGGEWAVECLVTDMVKAGKLRVTNKLFHLPSKWDALSELG